MINPTPGKSQGRSFTNDRSLKNPSATPTRVQQNQDRDDQWDEFKKARYNPTLYVTFDPLENVGSIFFFCAQIGHFSACQCNYP